uniref:Nuclear receptor domain-containing protein n=1 Tax=Haemonchus placei TaxID=6290 RepID=A0A0N4WA98_HAEPC
LGLKESACLQVCHTTLANGLHFGARTCAACAAFFRRTISDGKKYVCKRSQPTGYRKICRSCRLKRCMDIGMLPDSEFSISFIFFHFFGHMLMMYIIS